MAKDIYEDLAKRTGGDIYTALSALSEPENLR